MDYGTLTYTQLGNGILPQEWYLRLGSMTMGSGSENDVQLPDPAVSRFHARFLATAEGCWVTDMSSAMGTFLNQVRLMPNIRHPLRDGDTIKIGSWTVRYNSPGPPAGEVVALPMGTSEGLRPLPQVLPPEVAAKLPQLATPIQPAPVVQRLRGNVLQRVRRTMPGTQDVSSYLQYLPPLYHDDDFMGRFLMIFESILDPVERTIDSINYYFDPRLVPEALLPWLASWVDVVLNEKWPIERRRELVSRAADLYRWRGTRRGLSEYLRIYTGVEPTIEEPGTEARGSAELPDYVFRVTLEVDDPDVIERDLVQTIIEAEKPAYIGYELVIRRRAVEQT